MRDLYHVRVRGFLPFLWRTFYVTGHNLTVEGGMAVLTMQCARTGRRRVIASRRGIDAEVIPNPFSATHPEAAAPPPRPVAAAPRPTLRPAPTPQRDPRLPIQRPMAQRADPYAPEETVAPEEAERELAGDAEEEIAAAEALHAAQIAAPVAPGRRPSSAPPPAGRLEQAASGRAQERLREMVAGRV